MTRLRGQPWSLRPTKAYRCLGLDWVSILSPHCGSAKLANAYSKHHSSLPSYALHLVMDQSKVTMDTPVTAEEMKTWEKEAVLEWIQRKKPKLLKGNNLKIFNETDFSGDAFLLSSCEFFRNLDCLLVFPGCLKAFWRKWRVLTRSVPDPLTIKCS